MSPAMSCRAHWEERTSSVDACQRCSEQGATLRMWAKNFTLAVQECEAKPGLKSKKHFHQKLRSNVIIDFPAAIFFAHNQVELTRRPEDLWHLQTVQ